MEIAQKAWAYVSPLLLTWGGHLLSLIGVLISLCALKKARSVKKTVSMMLDRWNFEEDGARLKAIVAQLTRTKDIALRRSRATGSRNAGTRLSDDLKSVAEMHDALLTKLPLNCSDALRSDAASAAEDLEKALAAIDNGNAGGWKAAQATLQALIPRFEQAERQGRNQLVAPPAD